MSAMAEPVISRNAATMSSLMKQKPVSSLALTVPRNARLNSAVFTITVLPANLVLNDDVSLGIIFSAAKRSRILLIACRLDGY